MGNPDRTATIPGNYSNYGNFGYFSMSEASIVYTMTYSKYVPISGAMMKKYADILSDRTRLNVSGVPTSLADLGFTDVAIDGMYEVCRNVSAGILTPQDPCNYNFHFPNGTLMFRPDYFADPAAIVAYIHSKNLTAGWYLHNCHGECGNAGGGGEGFGTPKKPYTQWGNTTFFQKSEFGQLASIGFDNLKFDSCGPWKNDYDLWWRLFSARAVVQQKRFAVEAKAGWNVLTSGALLDTEFYANCPFTFYRLNEDNWNVQTFLTTLTQYVAPGGLANKNVSRPGCWAYMDQVDIDPVRHQVLARSEFGAKSILSSPLILGYLLAINSSLITNAHNQQVYLPGPDVYSIVQPWVTNQRAIFVNQNYFGFSGGAYKTVVDSARNMMWLYKPMSWDNTPVAVFVLNMGNQTATQNDYGTYSPGDMYWPAQMLADVNFAEIPYFSPGAQGVAVYDVWARQDLGVFSGSWSTTLGTHDSAFLLLGPPPAPVTRCTVADGLNINGFSVDFLNGAYATGQAASCNSRPVYTNGKGGVIAFLNACPIRRTGTSATPRFRAAMAHSGMQRWRKPSTAPPSHRRR